MRTPAGVQIIGSRRSPGAGTEFCGVDPRDGRELAPVYRNGGPGDVDAAAQLAWDAFASYRRTSPEERAAFLETIAGNLEAVSEELTSRAVAESGLPAARMSGELARTTGQLRLFASVVREGSWQGVRIETPLPERAVPRPDLRQRRVPLGPVAVFGASNFPLAFSVAGGDTASALAAGCPVVVKGHPSHPGTSEIVGEAVAAAVVEHALHEGVFSLLFGEPEEVAVPLVVHPRIKAVGFTGSRGAGLAIVGAAQARREPIPVYAEMSSINPVLVLPGALEQDAERLGRAFVGSLSLGQGQFCTNPGLVVAVDSPGLDRFVASAAAAIAEVPAGPMLNAGICAAYERGTTRLRGVDGVREVGTGRPDESIAAGGVPALFETDLATFEDEPVLGEEVFGATSLVVRVPDTEALVDLVDRLEGQLTATVHHGDGDEALAGRLAAELELRAGRVLFGGWPTGVDVGHAMVHGGPFPATSDGRSTSVGSLAIERFVRPVVYQDAPASVLPDAVADGNPLNLWRQVNGELGQH